MLLSWLTWARNQLSVPRESHRDRTVWQAAGAQLLLLVLNRGHVSHFSWGLGPALQMSAPQSWSRTPCPHPGAPPLLRAGSPSCELAGVHNGCPFRKYCPQGLSVAREDSLHLCLWLPALQEQACCLLCCLLWQGLLTCSAGWDAKAPSRFSYSHNGSLPLRTPYSPCVSMTHLELVLGQSLSLIKRHWLKMPQAHFQPLPREPVLQPRWHLTSPAVKKCKSENCLILWTLDKVWGWSWSGFKGRVGEGMHTWNQSFCLDTFQNQLERKISYQVIKKFCKICQQRAVEWKK